MHAPTNTVGQCSADSGGLTGAFRTAPMARPRRVTGIMLASQIFMSDVSWTSSAQSIEDVMSAFDAFIRMHQELGVRKSSYPGLYEWERHDGRWKYEDEMSVRRRLEKLWKKIRKE